jgi:pimeloyl-ACP methyl ester carboxylesterase
VEYDGLVRLSSNKCLLRPVNSWSPFRRAALMASVLGVGTLAGVFFLPLNRRPFSHQSQEKLLSYEEAVRAIRSLAATSPPTVRKECTTQLLEHGRPTERVFVLLHGLSNCPAQFAELGRKLFEHGHNVLIPLLPFHGEENRLATEWGGLTAVGMLDAGNQACDLARSLGQSVTVAGLSVNGATVAWLAQNRKDLSKAVLLAPFLAPFDLPGWALEPIERLLLRLPNMFFWWDPKQKENLPGPIHTYPRFPTRVIGETMLLARSVLDESRILPPQCPSILTITSASDTAANNVLTEQLIANWRALRPAGIDAFEFAADQHIPHDFIDPNQPNQKIAEVYPRIIELLEK